MGGIILSVDIGTSSLKAAFIDFSGKLLASGRAAYGSSQAIKRVDTKDWEKAFARCLEYLGEKVPDCSAEGICISGNGPTLVPVSGEGEALSPLFWNSGETAYPDESSGYKPASFFLPHAAWFRKNAPDEYARTRLFISSHEWLAHRLGAEAQTVLPQASYEAFYWDKEQCRMFDLDPEKFPPFVRSGAVMGTVSSQAALSFPCGNCLKSGIPIIAGGPDFITALIGTGAMESGAVCDRAGSSEGINVCVDAPPQADKLKDLRLLPHAREGLWNVGVLIPSSGRLFEWYRAASGQEARPYEELLTELLPSRVDPETFIKEYHDQDTSLETANGNQTVLSADKIKRGRAVLCSIGLAVRSAIRKLEASGLSVKEMRVSGGQGKNVRWNQLKADITGVTLMIPEIPDGELAGNAALSAAALEKTSIEAAVRRMIRIREVYKPHHGEWSRG